MSNFLASSDLSSDAYTPEQLVVGDNVKTIGGQTIKTTGGVVLRTTVMAVIAALTAASAAKAGGNTGNSVLTMDVTTPVQPYGFAGVYTVRYTDATHFTVNDPRGRLLGSGVNGTAFADQIKFNVATGGTPMVAGDGFDITLTAGAGKWVKAVYGATDSTGEPKGILVEDVDTTSGDSTGPVYVSGEFAMQGLVWDTSYDTDAKKLAAFPVGSTILVKKLAYSGT